MCEKRGICGESPTDAHSLPPDSTRPRLAVYTANHASSSVCQPSRQPSCSAQTIQESPVVCGHKIVSTTGFKINIGLSYWLSEDYQRKPPAIRPEPRCKRLCWRPPLTSATVSPAPHGLPFFQILPRTQLRTFCCVSDSVNHCSSASHLGDAQNIWVCYYEGQLHFHTRFQVIYRRACFCRPSLFGAIKSSLDQCTLGHNSTNCPTVHHLLRILALRTPSVEYERSGRGS